MPKYHFFVAYEFIQEGIREAIEQAFKGTELKGYFADIELKGNGKHILEKIEEMIFATSFGIYDITRNNPNVSLELGLARGAKKRFYIINKKGSKIPADLRGLDRIEYENYNNLTEEIKKKIVEKEVKKFTEIKVSLRQESMEIPEEKIKQKCCRLYQAETLLHRFGDEVEDKSASNKRAWFANLSMLRGHITFGPYEKLPEMGDYIAFFKIKIDDNSSSAPILLLEVIGGGFASKIIRGIHFIEPNKYQLFSVKFKCREIAQMEYRVFNQIQGGGNIWIDYIAIVKQSELKN